MALTDPREAWERLEKELERLPSETVSRPLGYGRVLALDLPSTVDVPASDVSAMDGYAVDTAVEAGERRPVTGVVAAGEAPGASLGRGAAMRVMTGAPVPEGTVTVVPVELTDNDDSEVLFRQSAPSGAHIRRRGEVLRTGEPLLEAGRVLTPGALSLLATHGYADVEVFRRPEVAFLTTGDEVVPPHVEPAPGQLRDSHTDFLLAAGRSLGLEFRHLGIAPDRPEVLEREIRGGLSADVLMVCGGVSMGEFDFVESILERLECRVLFDSVAIQPGKPLVAARHPGGWVIGLPGNPASVMVTFWVFVRPLLRRMMGHDDGYLTGLVTGTLGADAPPAKARDLYVPAELEHRDGRLSVHPVAPRGSHDQAAYARGSALLRIPANAPAAKAGDPCQVLPF